MARFQLTFEESGSGLSIGKDNRTYRVVLGMVCLDDVVGVAINEKMFRMSAWRFRSDEATRSFDD